MKTSFPLHYNEAMKKILLITVLFTVLVSGVAAYKADARIGVAWANARIADPNPSRSVSLGDASINGIGVSLGTAFDYYNDTAFWADISFVFPGDFRFDGAPVASRANSYIFFTDVSLGGALTFDMNSLELYVGLGYSYCEVFYRYDLASTMYREYSLSTSGPAAYLAGKMDLGRDLSIQLTAIPKLTIFTSRVTRDRGRYSEREKVSDFVFRTGFEVNASLSLVYTF